MNKATLYQENISAMMLEMNSHASSLSQTKHIEIRYFFIKDRIVQGYIMLEYFHTDKMVADMTKPLQGKQIFEFRNPFMGMPNCENISEVRKVRDKITQYEDLKNGQTDRGLKSKQFKQESNEFVSARPEPKGVCWNSKNN